MLRCYDRPVPTMQEAMTMDFEAEVLAIINASSDAQTVKHIHAKLTRKIEKRIREVANGALARSEIASVRGGGGWPTHYSRRPPTCALFPRLRVRQTKAAT